jgi:hypothetical protein
MTDTSSPSVSSGNSATDSSTSLSSGSSSVDSEIAQMNAAFALATQTNIQITVAKTVDGAEETAAQQRPNIG